MSLAGKGLVVAGDTALGKALAVAAASRGAQVVEGHASGVPGDPSSEADAERLFGVAAARLSRIDMVVSALPGFPSRLLADLTLAEWDETVARALRAAFFVSRLAVEEFLAHGAQGRLVHVVQAPQPGQPGQALAAACLESLLSLVRSTAKEYGPKGICCNAVLSLPGATTTSIVEAALFLASSESSYVNGEALRIGP